MKFSHLAALLLFVTFHGCGCQVNRSAKSAVVDNIVDIKDFKKLLRTKTNVLVCFYNSYKESQDVIRVFKEVAEAVKGEGTLVLIDCTGDAKKLCKKLKIPNKPYTLKHFKNGEFNKNYDRQYQVNSMTYFMRDPVGDLPWEEDPAATSIVHISDPAALTKLLRREPRPIMMLFYAPWCGFCKSLKPEYAQAADDLKEHSVLAAIDVSRPENAQLRVEYNISGFPTLLYFENGQKKFVYDGENKRHALVKFMKNPVKPTPKPREPLWNETDNKIVHLTTETFDEKLKTTESALVMFYAPWCGHCKKMKPEYEKAAERMLNEKIPGVLAAVDAMKESKLAIRYGVRGYPTMLYFAHGEKKFDVNARETQKILDFMRDPREPPPPPPPEKAWSEEASHVIHLDESNFKQTLKKKKHALVIFYAPWCGHCKKAKPEFMGAAANFKDDNKVAFAAVDCTQHSAVCSSNDVKGYPTFKYFNFYKNSKLYDGERTQAEFISFMHDPERSATTPEPLGGGGDWFLGSSIIHLDDRNFKSELKKAKTVLVMFYAPWCGHCKKMKPEFLSAARDLQKEGYDKCFAAVDCTANPNLVDEFKIDGFPTVKLFRNGKFVRDYNGKRNFEDLKAFVKANLGKDEL